jgi:diguanylate cyclase (GGDEF)-like protein/PAS domain S-box-containing protein
MKGAGLVTAAAQLFDPHTHSLAGNPAEVPLVAILDDQFTNRQIFARLAASVAPDVEVKVFADPVAALQSLAVRTPDLVITDFKMPFMDGAEFVRHFRDLPGAEDVPVVVLTVYEERSFRLRALECGATDFLQSPVDHQEFITRARNLLKLRRQQLLLAERANHLSAELEASARTHELALRASSERLAQVIDNIPAIVRSADLNGCLQFANAHQARLFGRTIESVVGQPLSDFLSEEQAARSRALDRMVWETGRSAPAFEEEIVDSDGIARVLLSSKSPLLDGAGQVAGILTTSVDITDRKHAEARLQHMSTHDAQTALPNRAALKARLEREIARSRRGSQGFALHMFDFDNFRSINDLHGYPAGDHLLVETARRLKDRIRRLDFAARIGGNTFAVLQAQCDGPEDARAFAGSLSEAVSASIEGPDFALFPTVGLGASIYPSDAVSADALFARADTASDG